MNTYGAFRAIERRCVIGYSDGFAKSPKRETTVRTDIDVRIYDEHRREHAFLLIIRHVRRAEREIPRGSMRANKYFYIVDEVMRFMHTRFRIVLGFLYGSEGTGAVTDMNLDIIHAVTK